MFAEGVCVDGLERLRNEFRACVRWSGSIREGIAYVGPFSNIDGTQCDILKQLVLEEDKTGALARADPREGTQCYINDGLHIMIRISSSHMCQERHKYNIQGREWLRSP